ncbi:DUF3017 domain-containing protein [Antrihabitans sp. YC2-6]|uniref:DUF3017 domain-containing protein n=1 Tax=Antrihabitans sp. YC2-6 TaxID=2799498 RepID=UPI0018F454E8|nr:DUF3017 domain-containing protein [Antrihabitans sp. YC2-6]MBJ8347395.1 DUF3017 domain-containing protein [Antrihabitans sp. YC2-6]
MVVVTIVIVVAVVLVLSERWRRGALVFGGGTLLAAAFRLCLPADRVGLLAVRGKGFDVLALVTVGTAIVLLAASIDPLGTG